MTPLRLLIAGTHSGVGKTTVAVGLMAALKRRGLRVAPFKVGPDYLDPGYHLAACGVPSAPLDTWMLGADGMRRSFARGCRGADITVAEGMMGLHDGARPDTDEGSTAEVAKLLRLPTVLVIDGSALARSAGALALGYRAFDAEVPLVGVIANRVACEGHARWLRPGIEEGAGLPLLAWLPPASELGIPERHLGLVGAGESGSAVGLVERLADAAEEYLDVPRLLGLASEAAPLPPAEPNAPPLLGRRARVAVARDEAFCFYYPDNLALLEAAGAELVAFSPIHNVELPERSDGLYLGGGYPELHAERLAGNPAMLRSIREFCAAGRPVSAECGGFMYLCQSLVDAAGHRHRMAGVLDGEVVMETRLQAIGYREVTFVRDTVLGPEGTVARGHEFRYSRHAAAIPGGDTAFRCGETVLGYAREDLLASYVHLHFGSRPEMAEHFVQRCALRA